MQRWDIINHLIKKNGYKSYLEIGYYKGWSFDRVECYEKTAVDPNPSKTPEQESWITGSANYEGMTCIIKLTSDRFFETGSGIYDIIFIDGLHESSQVDKDIQNALKHLNPGGTIVMHDCSPSSHQMTTTGTVNGEWTGDVYKSAIKSLQAFGNDEFCVVDTDYGVGILTPKGPKWNYEASIYDDYDWKNFNLNRKVLLNLISPEEFLEREKINHE